MTNIRLTFPSADEWQHCPYCGAKLERDQDDDLIVRNEDGEIDVEASEAAGYVFANSISHCGFDIRLWVSEYGEAEIE